MPRDKDLKRLVRARMKKTGEAYTAARTNILGKPRRKTSRTAPPAGTAAARSSAPATADYAGIAGMSDEAIEAKTGRTWERWVFALDRHGAHEMAHRDIAAVVSEKYEIGEWWCQMVTVGYERIKGLRARGQRRDGSYEASKSRTYDVPVMALFDAWADAGTRRRWLDGAAVRVRTATAPKSIRLGWRDGSIVVVGFTPKGESKSAVAVQHTKLPDRETANRLEQYWGERLDALGVLLAGR
jgi:hypothetical protein